MEKPLTEKGSLDPWESTQAGIFTPSGTDLVYVLAEGRNSGELTDEVEVGSGDRVNSAAVERRQSLVSRQSQVLERRKREP